MSIYIQKHWYIFLLDLGKLHTDKAHGYSLLVSDTKYTSINNIYLYLPVCGLETWPEVMVCFTIHIFSFYAPLFEIKMQGCKRQIRLQLSKWMLNVPGEIKLKAWSKLAPWMPWMIHISDYTIKNNSWKPTMTKFKQVPIHVSSNIIQINMN